MAATASPLTINIDVVNDLRDASHLKALLKSQTSSLFSIGSEFAQFLGKPIGNAMSPKPVKVTVQAPGMWKTSSGIGFALGVDASCTLAVSDRSTAYSVAKRVDSEDTRNIQMGPAAGSAWINLEFDFDIHGSVSGSGTAGGVGISGTAAGSRSASLSYCHRVDAGVDTLEAIKEAFSALTLPFEPDCALVMEAGDIGKVNFDAKLGFELDATYGLGSYKFSAPGIDSAHQSFKAGVEKFTPPSLDIETGAKASLGYTHQDHFGVIVSKPDGRTATVDLVRSAGDEVDFSAGVTAGVSVTKVDVSLDQKALAQAVDKVTHVGGALVATIGDKLQASLADRTNTWLSSLKGDAGLKAELLRQTNRALLYSFRVDLANADLVGRSWAELAQGDLRQALRIGGLQLLPGSGMSDQLKRSVTIGLHFFNLFSVTSVESYFQNSSTEIGPDGSIRFLFDIGQEQDAVTKKATQASRIHFVAGAVDEDHGSVGDVEVDLHIELSETGKRDEAARIAATIGSIQAPEIAGIQEELGSFAAANPSGRVSVVSILKRSAYQRITCSPYTGPKHDIPPALPQADDAANFEAFRQGTERILDLEFAGTLTYDKWQQFNLICNGKDRGVPDRRNPGNPQAVPSSFYGALENVAGQVRFLLLSGATFMNLCDDLQALAGLVGEINTLATWNSLLGRLTELVTNDVENDWSKPAASAIFGRFGDGVVRTDVEQGKGSLTCTITLA